MGIAGPRIAAFLFGCLFAVAGGGGGAVAVYGAVRTGQTALLVFGGFGAFFGLVGVGLVYLAVTDTDRWAEGDGVDVDGYDVGAGWGDE